MDETPIFASVARDLHVSYEELAMASRPTNDDTSAVPVIRSVADGRPDGSGDRPGQGPVDRFDRRWRSREHQPGPSS